MILGTYLPAYVMHDRVPLVSTFGSRRVPHLQKLQRLRSFEMLGKSTAQYFVHDATDDGALEDSSSNTFITTVIPHS